MMLHLLFKQKKCLLHHDGAGNYVFKTSDGSSAIPIFEGESKTKTFLVGESFMRASDPGQALEQLFYSS